MHMYFWTHYSSVDMPRTAIYQYFLMFIFSDDVYFPYYCLLWMVWITCVVVVALMIMMLLRPSPGLK